MLSLSYFGKRFDLILTSDPREYSLGFTISSLYLALDLVFLQFTYRFMAVEAEGWV